MRVLGSLANGIARLLPILAIGFGAAGGAQAQVPVTNYIVIQPIDVCGTGGPKSSTGCAPFNTLSKSPDPTAATLTTPIGFVDTTTNTNVTRAIWLQTGIDVTFLPILEYNNTTDQAIEIDCSTATNPCTGTLTSSHFKALSSGTPGTTSGCSYDCAVPLAPVGANALNMFFVNSLTGGTGVTGTLFGFAWINNNGVAISKPTFFPSLGHPTFDTLAHEMGHNLNLDHFSFGAGTLCSGTVMPNPKGCNVMDAGSSRIIPASTGCTAQSTTSTSSTGGTLYDLDTGLCLPAAPNPIADNLILATNSQLNQQGEALLSGFMNPVPNVGATAGGGDVSLTVNFPKPPPGSKVPNGRAGEFIAALVLALPEGFKFGNPAITFSPAQTPQVFSVELLNGNNGQGNTNCLKPLSGTPSIPCAEIDFALVNPSGPPPYIGTFVQNTSFSFTANIINKSTGLPATFQDLQCAVPTVPSPQQCLDLTYVFNDLFATTSFFQPSFDKHGNLTNLTANSQFPDNTVTSTIVDPATFPSIANLNPPLTLTGATSNGCTLTGTSTSCPPVSQASGGDPTGPD